MQSKKTSSGSHAFFGWAIKEIASQPSNIFLMGNQRKRLATTKRFFGWANKVIAKGC
jgi:hypothetical protein